MPLSEIYFPLSRAAEAGGNALHAELLLRAYPDRWPTAAKVAIPSREEDEAQKTA